MRQYAHACAEADATVRDAVREIGRRIDAMRIARLWGVVLGGGYGRGEGGVIFEGGKARLSNDLDFYVVTERGATRADERAIAAALAPIAREWTARLGVDVDFCAPKTPRRMERDSRRLMIQELLRGYADVAGRPGVELFADIEERPLSQLPWMEAVRLLVNRGAGMLLCAERGDDAQFTARNIDKCVLGAFDAALMARGEYVWGAEARAAAIRDPRYDAALSWKFRPAALPPCTAEDARKVWLWAADMVEFAPARAAEGRRRAWHALRWLARRRTLGDLRSLGIDPLLRILGRMRPLVRDGAAFPPALKRDWMVFN